MNTPAYINTHTVLFERKYPTSLQRLWKAVSEKNELDTWLMETEIDLRAGGKFEFKGGWNGWIGELKEFEYIQFNSAEDAFSRFELEPLDGFCLLRLIDKLPADITAPKGSAMENSQPGGKGTHWVGLLAGWHDFLDGLEAYLAGERIEDNYSKLCHMYGAFLERKFH